MLLWLFSLTSIASIAHFSVDVVCFAALVFGSAARAGAFSLLRAPVVFFVLCIAVMFIIYIVLLLLKIQNLCYRPELLHLIRLPSTPFS